MNDVFVNGKLVRFRNAVIDVAIANLKDTLALVPNEHLLRISLIEVVPPQNFGHGPNYAGGGSGLGYPRLSELCFSRRHRESNFPINLTLLHEIGHILDHQLDCLENLTGVHRATLEAIPIPSSARTHGDGEQFAIAYQQVITGGASEEIRAAVLASRAFEGVDLVRR